MTSGSNYVYKCPCCENLITNRSLASANTFDAKNYSDGKEIAPNLPEYPNLTKCKKCNTIFWLSNLIKIGKFYDDSDIKPEWQNVDKAAFLQIADFFRALQEGVANNLNEELSIRFDILWAYNDRIRNQEIIFNDKHDELKWNENANKMLLLLDQLDLDKKLLTAEINRNIGNFEACIEILNSIENSDIEWFKTRLINECNQKNRWVIELN